MNWLIKLFPPNDWTIVWATRGEWDIHVTDDWGKYRDSEYCTYEIEYSKFRNEYRMWIGGHDPKAHSLYPGAVQKLQELKNQ